MWSTCSIETGHSWTHAPQVTQSQTTSSVTAFGTSGVSVSSGERYRALGEELVANAHDQELRRERLAGRIRRADVLAAAALGARHRVEHLLPGEVGDRAGAEAQCRLVLRLEVERLEATSRTRSTEEDVDRRGRDVQVLRVREVGQEAEDDQHVRPHEDALEHLGRRVVRKQPRERVDNRRPAGGPRVQVERDERRVPEQQRGDDAGDQREDEVGLAQVAALRTAAVAAPCGSRTLRDTDEDERREHVDEERVPPLALEPAERGARGKRLVTLEDRRDRHEDRREEDEESPEDEGVHEARDEPLEELPLTENDDRLVAHAGRNVSTALLADFPERTSR